MAPPAAPTALHHRTPLLLPRRTVALGATATARAARAASLAVRAQPDTTAAAVSTSAPEPAPEFKPPPGFKAPEPKRYEVKSGQVGSVLGASLAIPLRLGTGVFVLGYSPSLVSPSEIPSDQYALEFGAWKLSILSEGEYAQPLATAFCRCHSSCTRAILLFVFTMEKLQVREMVTVLDLDVLFYPCPQKGPTFRPKVLEMGGKKQFPYMVDPNTGVAMYESDDIIKYLADTYGVYSTHLLFTFALKGCSSLFVGEKACLGLSPRPHSCGSLTGFVCEKDCIVLSPS
ncbi:Thioredoxin family protein [Zea mays]|uniref:Thioredoxin family protein n=1 Tax=Zea mays TaxID=4577 RepID=A0A1D6KMN8_MAIZE|nr:Thioredoxin family protein [Zea mays]ONM04100.1 Thioredoxin family protein [Zea mays]